MRRKKRVLVGGTRCHQQQLRNAREKNREGHERIGLHVEAHAGQGFSFPWKQSNEISTCLATLIEPETSHLIFTDWPVRSVVLDWLLETTFPTFPLWISTQILYICYASTKPTHRSCQLSPEYPSTDCSHKRTKLTHFLPLEQSLSSPELNRQNIESGYQYALIWNKSNILTT